jgi:hypothetical protein
MIVNFNFLLPLTKNLCRIASVVIIFGSGMIKTILNDNIVNW